MYAEGHDQSAFEGRGKWGRFFGRVLENPDNPLGWSVRLFVWQRIDVRIHLITVIFMIGVVLASIPSVGDRGWLHLFTLSFSMFALFVIVLLHEFGHCFGARWTGGSASRIVMLPIGGLALANPANNWRSHLITAASGPAVNVAMIPLTVLGLYATGQGQTILFNPFVPIAAVSQIDASSTISAFFLQSLWWFHYINFIILAFNVLLIFFPFDGGRIVQSILWARIGYLRSMTAAVYTGLIAATLLLVVALVISQAMLVAIGAFGLLACWVERTRIRSADEITGYIPADHAGLGGVAPGAIDELADPGPSRAEIRRQQREEREQAELDRILEKISRSGMDSLTASERRLLANQTKKQRGG